MSDEWGPWQNRGITKANGMYVQVYIQHKYSEYSSRIIEGTIVIHGTTADMVPEPDIPGIHNNWSACQFRIRRPKALQKLIKMVENLPVRKPQYEDA